jgi:hypothetical protein
MADITVTAAQVGLVFPEKAEVYDFIAAATITAGQVVYQDSAGKANLADANGSGTVQARGIALNGGGAGQAISVLKKGHVYGFTVSGVAYDDPVYLSNTAGALADAAGGTSVICGRVVSLTNGTTLTKVLHVEFDWLRTWA